ncbi:ATPase E1-E2 type family protein / haloacid dehalogenase-like hydrolase family protein [Euphorbia peplus]|nr:ATPase E1-E2 type family protein / haloacid dehalogenase-like hydrolase family protein [Euphorbia peplus]
MAGGGRRRKLRLSKIYSFGCGKASLQEEHSQIGGPGFSRVVFCNEAESFESGIRNYESNYVRTTKYTPASFLPKSLFEQFRRVANFYFLVSGIVSFTPLSPYGALSAIIPLIFVIAATMTKELLEDLKRKQQDIEMNNRKVKVHKGDGIFKVTEWKNIKVGDIVKVEKDQFFPADLALLSSSYDDAVCYVETMNLDGETNLKVKQAVEQTVGLHDDSDYKDFKAMIRCEDPNANLYAFVGTLDYEENQYPLSPQQLLLRDSKLRNTEYVYGVVIFTGSDTKVMQNSRAPPSKRSRIEKKMDKIVYLLFGIVFTMSVIGSIVFGVTTKNDLEDGKVERWYLQPEDSEVFFDPEKSALAGIFHFMSALLLYSYFIPISLYVSIEIVKVLQSVFINRDLNMYHEETDRPAHARTSNLTEELGQVDTVLSDKTGTLTCNSMEFIKCSVAGTAYGRGVTEVEEAMDLRNGPPVVHGLNGLSHKGTATKKPHVKGFNFEDERVMNGNWVHEPNAKVIQEFFRLLAVCHTAIAEEDENTGKISYEAESPDEAAFVIAARELGFEFCRRTQTSIVVREFDIDSGRRVERSYQILNVIEFNSTRKRMSVIVRTEDGRLLLLCKGADSIMFERIALNGKEYEQNTRKHVNEYADAGLRTLLLAYRELKEEEYKDFSDKFTAAKMSVSADRDAMLDELAEKMERNLVLLGATAVEDKLQDGVPQCIDRLAQAGIKIWVLTGDKMETAINIGFACSLLRQGMTQIIIGLETPEIQSLEKAGDKTAIAKASKDSVLRQINEGMGLVSAPRNGSDAFALIIDGKSLAYALEDDVKHLFLKLAVSCASVICCRSSPKQKGLVTKLVKEGTGKTTLAIGDGANDVGMLQEADIGIGISGVEGMQAVMSSDVSIAQFRYLERLLLLHGHWCYRRISSMICYFFYKNIAFGFTLFLYEAYTTFSAQPAYNDWFMSLYSVLFTSLPVIALGVLDQDVPAESALKYPLLYQQGIQNLLFSWRRIISWMCNGFYGGIVIFFLCTKAYEHQAFNDDGKTVGRDILGATMYSCVVWAVNLQMVLFINYFTTIQHFLIWGSVALWYIFLAVYGAMSPTASGNAYKVLVEALAPTPSYWLVMLFAVVATIIPYFVFSAVQNQFFPMYHQFIQWMNKGGEASDPEYAEIVRQTSVRPTIGTTARRASKRENRNR